ERLVAARTPSFLFTRCRTRDQATGLTALQAELHRGGRGGAHDATSAVRSPAAAHATRFHASRGSKLACIAARRKTRPPSAKSATPGTTVAQSAIMISADTTAISITTIMLQMRVVGW